MLISSDKVFSNDRYLRLTELAIMLVDDEPIMLDIVQALLEEEGYRKFIAIQDPREAFHTIVEQKPDIILLDLDMPKINGYQVLKQIRTIPAYKFLPVIILTASSDSKSKLDALELGATDFLSKPVDPSELALRVRNTLLTKVFQDQLAFYDSLTGLPNRKLFIELLTTQIEVVKREGKTLSLINISLNNFYNINETYGLSVGEEVLKSVVSRLEKVIKSSDVLRRGDSAPVLENIARVNGDEFAVMLKGVKSQDDLSYIASRVLESITGPIEFSENEVFLSPSMGISSYPADAEDVESLIKHSGTANEVARKRETNNYQFYSAKMNEHVKDLLKMQADLRRAIERDEFELYYQPKVDAVSGNVVGMESLIRWNHPNNGMVSPLKFIPLAEKMELIIPLGEWILQEACNRASEWFKDDFKNLTVSVNVSAVQFSNKGFKASVQKALLKSGLPAKNLVLEITESMLIGDLDQLSAILIDIKKLGVSFSLDDFGTGYSSLSYLQKFPIDELKVDRSFIIEIPQNEDGNTIVRAIIAMAHTLGQKVVAEGVEKVDQFEFLRTYNCDVIQGYYFSKPLNKNDFTEYLNNQKKIIARSRDPVDGALSRLGDRSEGMVF